MSWLESVQVHFMITEYLIISVEIKQDVMHNPDVSTRLSIEFAEDSPDFDGVDRFLFHPFSCLHSINNGLPETV